MTLKSIILVLLAITCGASAAVGVNELRQKAINQAPKVERVPVVVAADNVARGSVLSAEVLTTRDWPKDMLPPGVLESIEDATERCVMVPLVRGEPILQSKLTDKKAGSGLASMIPSGMRAFTIQTPHVAAGVGGFILPGNHVDILLTTDSAGYRDVTGGGATTTLLQDVEVLAVDQRLEAPDEQMVDVSDLKSVTLLVTPQQASKLDLGMNKGILHLSMRNPDDHDEARTSPTTMAQLQFDQQPPTGMSGMQALFGQALTAVTDAMKADRKENAVSQAEAPIREARIMTLRGLHRGSVRISN